jgi:hypothetical protein
MIEKLKALGANAQSLWNYIQELMDVRGDMIMMIMSAVFIGRVVYAAFGHPALNASEAAMYGSAIASFAYSNKS